MDRLIRDHCGRAWALMATALSGGTAPQATSESLHTEIGCSTSSSDSVPSLSVLALRLEVLERKMARVELDALRREEQQSQLRCRPDVVAFVSTVVALIGLILVTEFTRWVS